MARALAGLAALMSALCIASAAWAHATLVSSEPADGSVLAQPPKMVQLHFNESIAPTASRTVRTDTRPARPRSRHASPTPMWSAKSDAQFSMPSAKYSSNGTLLRSFFVCFALSAANDSAPAAWL